MKTVIFYTKSNDQETEVGRVWNEEGELRGTVSPVFLEDLKDWLRKSDQDIDNYLADLHRRFDGGLFYAGLYKEDS